MNMIEIRAERAARAVADRRKTILKHAAYLATKALTTAEKNKLAILRANCDDGKTTNKIHKLAAPFYRGDCRQIAAAFEGVAMVERDAAWFTRAVNMAESALSPAWPAESYRTLVTLADRYGVKLPKLATKRGKATRDTEPADSTSLARWFPMPR